MSNKITFDDKVDAKTSTLARVNKVVAEDMNEIKTKFNALEDRVQLNDAKVSNVSTNLSEGAADDTTVVVESSDGNNATLNSASTSRAGLMSKAKFDEVEANKAKVSFPEAPADGNQYARKDNGWDQVVAGGVTDGDKGEIVVSGGGSTWTIKDGIVTYSKIQDVTDERLLGNFSGSDDSVQEIELSDDLQVLLGVLGLKTLPLYIEDSVAVALLDDAGNWTGSNYTGPSISGTRQGQNHYNSTYWFTCVHDNVWIRMARA